MSVTISIVSHNQATLVNNLLDELNNIKETIFDVIVISNIKENIPINQLHKFSFTLIKNDKPLGFGANHNKALLHCKSDYFLILNPDISITDFNMNSLISHFDDKSIGIVAPAVVNPLGMLEDSVREFPTPLNLLLRIFRLQKSIIPIGISAVDWVAGMFILIKRDIFVEINGFDDESFYMYLEDVDLCKRVNKLGYSILYDPTQKVIHNARRSSRKSIRHMYWHISSMFRYFTNY
jgi:GT2 family glycosyltransferase